MANSPLDELREAARACQACPLWANATQTVFGAGDPRARVMLVGEQPGDEEDRKGLPFVGPAGRLLERALEAAGVSRSHLYVTNAVKHFKWQLRGKRRLHNPSALLRLRGEEEKELAFAQLVKDLELINRALDRP